MKTLLTVLALLIIKPSFSQTQPQPPLAIQTIPNGSYLGKFRGDTRGAVNLVVQGYPGCQGCFVAIFVVDPGQNFFRDRTPELAAFSAIPARLPVRGAGGVYSIRYALTQFNLNVFGPKADGKLTILSGNPDLVIDVSSVQSNKDGSLENVKFSVVSASGTNTVLRRLSAGMTFNQERESPFELSAPQAGHFEMYGKRRNIFYTGAINRNTGDTAHSAMSVWSGTRFIKDGNFVLKEQVPYVYSLARVTLTEIGDEEQFPNYLVMFLRKGTAFSDRQVALFVNPAQAEDVLRYDLRDEQEPQELVTYVNENFKDYSAANQALGTTVLEYPDGPTSKINDAQYSQAMKDWRAHFSNETKRIRFQLKHMISDEDKKQLLTTRLKALIKDTKTQPWDLLARHSVAAALTIVNIMDESRKLKGWSVTNPVERRTPGETSEQVDLLVKSLDIADKYHEADRLWIEKTKNDLAHLTFNDQLITFGMELSQYVADMAVRLRPLNVLASYGALRWSLGILIPYILDDRHGAIVQDTTRYLKERLDTFPTLEDIAPNSKNPQYVMNDIEIAVKIQDLKGLFVEIQGELKDGTKK